MEIKERIQLYLDRRGIKTAPFEKEVGLSNGYWRKTKSISAKCVEDILKVYTDLSAEWIFRGTGSMYLEQTGIVSEDTPSIGESYYKELVQEMEQMKDKINNIETKVG